MSTELGRKEKFKKIVEQTSTFIIGATDFLYNQIEDPTMSEIVECSKAIVAHNFECLEKQIIKLGELEDTIRLAKPITETKEEIESIPESIHTIKTQPKDIQELIDLVMYNYLDDETFIILAQQSHHDLVRIKLYFYKLILETTKAIREYGIYNPSTDIRQLQSDLETYNLIVETITEFEKKDQVPTPEKIESEYSNIVFAPNSKSSTYLYEDISEYPEKSKEIRLILEKIVDGYFLKTKDLKSIEGYQENIYEYKHPNGIRILYVVMGNIVIICSLFMKDKQKSTRISNEYEEAINRYYEVKEYVTENFNNPDFHIEQAELVGEIFKRLDGIALAKKVGDE